MTYSKSRPKILSSGIMDALSSFAYFVLAILFFIFGAVLLNTDVSGGEDNMSGAIQEIGGAFATGILGVLSIVVGIICLIAMLISLVGTVITLRSVNKDFSALKNLTCLKSPQDLTMRQWVFSLSVRYTISRSAETMRRSLRERACCLQFRFSEE